MSRWVPVYGYEGIYEVSSRGDIRRVGASRGARIGRVLRQKLAKRGGYPIVTLSDAGLVKTWPVHQIVCLSFHGDRPTPAHEVAHKDGVPTNVSETNLRWATRKENSEDSREHGTLPIGERHGSARLTLNQVAEIRALLEKGEVKAAIARRYSIGASTVTDIYRGRTWPDAGRK